MQPVAIAVLSKYIDVYTPFLKSLRKFDRKHYPVYCVIDGSTPDKLEKWQGSLEPQVSLDVVKDKFSMAGNGNIALSMIPLDHDVLYCGDDVRFLQEETIEKLQEVAYSDPEIGLLSPTIVGRGSPLQVAPPHPLTAVPPIQMWFPCIYIKRELINKIGYLDEQFNNFGSDDVDYCIRTM